MFLETLLSFRRQGEQIPSPPNSKSSEKGEHFMTATIQVDPVRNCAVCSTAPDRHVQICPRFCRTDMTANEEA
ncbi:hypothetical protein T4A_5754 [Trichinella pseudospiralis]|uniref:Uncharacterized protein n=1 Tax=Trichinella pseudospiralis TaxID=6337 RepID=A0A0V1DZQ9_TRIPS|nr:hypothetical protein T4A_5754 [Trichinella pseudospiralis]